MLRFLPRRLAFPLSLLPRAVAASVTEVRLRLNAPLSLSLNGRNLFVDEHGKVCRIESALRADEDDLRATLAAQVKSPVRWEETVRNMADAGADFFCEVGPGKVLSGLIRRILPEAQVFNVENAETLTLCVQAAQAHDEKERKGQ